MANRRRSDLQPFEHGGAEFVRGSYFEDEVRGRLVEGVVDVRLHLASLQSGAAERHAALGKTVNVDGSMALFDTPVWKALVDAAVSRLER